MKKIILVLNIILLSFTLVSCGLLRFQSKPQKFTYLYDQKDTGLGNLLDIDGFFTGNPDIGGIFFFKDGLVCNFEVLLDGNINYLLWGTYIIEDSIIKTQRVVDTGIDGLEVNRDFFRIINRKEIKREGYISYHDIYITERQYSLNYASLKEPISTKTCWLLKKKWFWTKEAWEHRNK